MPESDDRPELTGTQPTEQELPNGNEAAHRRLIEDQDNLLTCEHSGDAQREAAVDRSAQIMEQWEKTKDPGVRSVLLEKVGREMMDVHEAPAPPIHVKELGPGVLGKYYDREFRMELEKSQLEQDNPKDALETYLHEYRHAEQSYEVQKSHGVGLASVNTERAAAMEQGDGNLRDLDAESAGVAEATEIRERMEELRGLDHSDLPPASQGDAIAQRRLAAERDGYR